MANSPGSGKSSILANLQRLHDADAKILLRCPMIPRYNARREHLEGIVALARRLPRVEGVELLPYYDLWRAKLARFGLKAELPETVKPPNGDTVNGWKEYLQRREFELSVDSAVSASADAEGSEAVDYETRPRTPHRPAGRDASQGACKARDQPLVCGNGQADRLASPQKIANICAVPVATWHRGGLPPTSMPPCIASSRQLCSEK